MSCQTKWDNAVIHNNFSTHITFLIFSKLINSGTAENQLLRGSDIMRNSSVKTERLLQISEKEKRNGLNTLVTRIK
jgi:hypothetical protein